MDAARPYGKSAVRVDVTVNGRPWNVLIEQRDQVGQFVVDVNGRTRVIDMAWIDADTMSLIDGTASREIRIHHLDGGVLNIAVEGRTFEAVVATQKRRRVPVADPHSSVVKAPMPGRIVRVLAIVGERVSAGQEVAIIEAMKMENALRAPRDGTVTEIVVAAGDAVDAGAVILVIGD